MNIEARIVRAAAVTWIVNALHAGGKDQTVGSFAAGRGSASDT